MNRPSILVVEDEAIIAADIEERLASLGYDVADTVATCADALDAFRANTPDLVLMDVILRGPDDGIEAASRIKERTDTPIVFLTASADPNTLSRLRREGASGYIRKPFDDRTLEMTIELALVRHAAERERTRTIAALEAALARVRTLEGLLPICSVCKDIRDESGHWQRIEQYIASHTEAQFTHGYCPTCADDVIKSIGHH